MPCSQVTRIAEGVGQRRLGFSGGSQDHGKSALGEHEQALISRTLVDSTALFKDSMNFPSDSQERLNLDSSGTGEASSPEDSAMVKGMLKLGGRS